MPRPWKATPEQVERDGMWSDFAAFGSWWYEHIEESLPESEDGIWDGLSIGQQTTLYSKLAAAFDALDESVDELAAEGEKAFEDGPQAWADWNAKALDFGD